MSLTYFFRKQKPGFFSIETLFNTIAAHLNTSLDINIYRLNHESKSVLSIIRNIFYARKHQSQINHITGDVHYIALGLRKRKTVLTIHDLVPLRQNNGLKKWGIKMLWYTLPCHKAQYITVISKATKSELLSRVKVNEEKIRVIPNCLTGNYTYHPKSFNKHEPVILQIGTKKNKNLDRIARALQGISCKLHILGKLTARQIVLLEKMNILYNNDVHSSQEEVINLYRNCDLLLYASTYEGFGLPIIEAQATGRPVITSNISAMPETAGEGAILVDPYHVDEIKQAVISLIENDNLREEIIHKGLKNVQKFSVRNIAGMYLDLYKEMMQDYVT